MTARSTRRRPPASALPSAFPAARPFAGAAVSRSLVLAAQLLMVVLLVFVLSLLMPGDAADVQSGDLTTDAQRAESRHVLGLDATPVDRFLRWLGGVVHGDLGTSLTSGRPVSTVVAEPLLFSAVLAFATVAVLVPLSIAAGYAAGLRPGTLLDRVVTAVFLLADSIPDFVLATGVIAFFSLRLGLFPATFVGLDTAEVLAEPGAIVLPVAVMVVRTSAPLVRLVRAGVAGQLEEPYIVQARRLGVSRLSLYTRHMGPNALAPAIQELGRTGDGLVSGVLIVEAIFAAPGIATALIGAVGNRDEPVVLTIVLFTGAATVLINALIDRGADVLVPQRRRR